MRAPDLRYSGSMNHTPQVKKAIQYAARKHDGHKRKDADGTPYVTHLFSVALLVAENGAHDDVVTAALLHDTIEDTPTTYEELCEAFNERVASLVQDVSEIKELPWQERADRYLEHLETAPLDALLIAIADKIDNIEDKLAVLEREGAQFLNAFSEEPAAYVAFYGRALELAERRLPDHPLTKRLAEVHESELHTISGLGVPISGAGK